jgi:hypothetical protein
MAACGRAQPHHSQGTDQPGFLPPQYMTPHWTPEFSCGFSMWSGAGGRRLTSASEPKFQDSISFEMMSQNFDERPGAR